MLWGPEQPDNYNSTYLWGDICVTLKIPYQGNMIWKLFDGPAFFECMYICEAM